MALDILYAGTLPPHPCGAAISCSRTLIGLSRLGCRIRAVAPITASALETGDPFARACPEVELTRFLVPHFQSSSPVPSADEYRRVEREESARLVAELLEDERPDVVVVGRESFAWELPALAESHDVPCVVIVHGGSTFAMLDRGRPEVPARRLLEQLRRASVVVAPAAHLVERLQRLGLTRLALVPNAVDLERFHPGPRSDELVRRLGIGPDDLVVAHLSNLSEVKRPLDLVASAAQALRERDDLVYVVVGDGPYRRAMEDRCAELGIASRFRFVGWVDYDDVPEYLRLADLVAVTSAAEGQALVYLEAQASGRTLLASDIPAAREVVRHSRTGLLFGPGELAAATLHAAGDPELRDAIGRAARREVVRHSLDRAVAAYDELLAGLVPSQALAN